LNIQEEMLAIKLEKILNYKQKYWVYLDSENKYAFDNKRLAKDFLTKISKQLTDTVVFINEEYCQVEMIYRQYYFLIEDFQLRCSIENSIEFIRNRVGLLLFRNGGENRNTLVITGIENMLFELKTGYELLSEFAISRGDTGTKHKIASKIRILDLFMIDFKQFEDEITVSRSEIKINHKVKLRRVI
jgi:hypothetical protein